MEELIAEQAETIADLRDELAEALALVEKRDLEIEDLDGNLADARSDVAAVTEELENLRDALGKFLLDQLGTHNPTHTDFIAKGWPVDLTRELM